jgi:hypothetical protein
LVLQTITYPYGKKIKIENFKADSNGLIKVDSERDWQMAVLLPHGETFYDWAWCVQAQGYKATSGRFRDGQVIVPEYPEAMDTNSEIIIHLTKSFVNSECDTTNTR